MKVRKKIEEILLVHNVNGKAYAKINDKTVEGIDMRSRIIIDKD